MKPIYLSLALLLVATTALAEMRTWTAQNGKTFIGELVSVDKDKAKLKDEDGKTVSVPIAGLCQEDQDYIASHEPIDLEIELDSTTTTNTGNGCCPRIKIKSLESKPITRQLDLYVIVFDDQNRCIALVRQENIEIPSNHSEAEFVLDTVTYPEKREDDILAMVIDSDHNLLVHKTNSKKLDDPHLMTQLLNQSLSAFQLQASELDRTATGAINGLIVRMYDLSRKRNGMRSDDVDAAEFITQLEQSNPYGFYAYRLKMRYYPSPYKTTTTELCIPAMSLVSASHFLALHNDDLLDHKTKLKKEKGRYAFHFQGRVAPTKDITFRFVPRSACKLYVWMDGKFILSSIANERKHTPFSLFPAGNPEDIPASEWMEWKAGEAKELDVLMIPSDNNFFGGGLFVQFPDIDYPVDTHGFPILPLFTTRELSEDFLSNFYSGFIPGMKPLEPVIFNVVPKE